MLNTYQIFWEMFELENNVTYSVCVFFSAFNRSNDLIDVLDLVIIIF